MFSHMACVAENKRENKQSNKNERGNQNEKQDRNMMEEKRQLSALIHCLSMYQTGKEN